jgi:serine O-acetyltransferase
MSIELSLPTAQFERYVRGAIEAMFPDGSVIDVRAALQDTFLRVAECFSRVALPGYARNGSPYLSHLHGDQSAIFWYVLSNSAFNLGDKKLAEKCMLVNKARNGILIMYDTQLPKHFLLIHTVGTMLGKADYGDYFVATQNVTVGTNKGHAPTFGRGVVLYPNSSVIGDCSIGDFSRVATGSTVIDTSCPARTVISGTFPDLVTKLSARETITEYFSF